MSYSAVVQLIKAINGPAKLQVKRRCFRLRLPSKGGKYGLGLRGGADTDVPIMISRIAPDSPASADTRIQVAVISLFSLLSALSFFFISFSFFVSFHLLFRLYTSPSLCLYRFPNASS